MSSSSRYNCPSGSARKRGTPCSRIKLITESPHRLPVALLFSRILIGTLATTAVTAAAAPAHRVPNRVLSMWYFPAKPIRIPMLMLTTQ